MLPFDAAKSAVAGGSEGSAKCGTAVWWVAFQHGHDQHDRKDRRGKGGKDLNPHCRPPCSCAGSSLIR